MAYVRQRSSTWYVCYRDDRGRLVERATEARTKTEARRFASELARRHDRVRLGLEPPAPEAITFARFAEDWLARVAYEQRRRN